MDKHTLIWWISVIIVLAIIAIGFLIYAKNFTYKPFTLDEQGCEVYEESCVCVGLLSHATTYPPQYDCKGINLCKDIEETQCRQS